MEYHGYAYDVGRLYACLEHFRISAGQAKSWSVVTERGPTHTEWTIRLDFAEAPNAERPVCAGHDPVHDTI